MIVYQKGEGKKLIFTRKNVLLCILVCIWGAVFLSACSAVGSTSAGSTSAGSTSKDGTSISIGISTYGMNGSASSNDPAEKRVAVSDVKNHYINYRYWVPNTSHVDAIRFTFDGVTLTEDKIDKEYYPKSVGSTGMITLAWLLQEAGINIEHPLPGEHTVIAILMGPDGQIVAQDEATIILSSSR